MSGPRRAATGSSPRPTSTSSTSGSLAPHYEAELPLVIADAFSKLPVGPFRIQVNNRKIPEGFYLGLGLTDVKTVLRIVDKLDKIGPGKVAALLVEAGATDEQAAALPGAGRDLLAATCPSSSGCAPSASSTPTLDEGLDALAAVMRAAMEHAPGLLVADLRIARGLDYYTGTVYETQLVGQESYGSICSGGRYDALASDGRTTYPGVGISIGVSRLLGRLVGPQGLSASRSTPTCVLVLAGRRGGPGGRACASPRRCASGGSPSRWPRPRRSSASRSASPSGAASPSSGSPGRGSPATRSRTSAAGSRSTRTRRRGRRRRPTCVRASSRRTARRGDGGSDARPGGSDRPGPEPPAAAARSRAAPAAPAPAPRPGPATASHRPGRR